MSNRVYLKNKGYYYRLIFDNGKYQIYEQWDDESKEERFVSYEIWKNGKHWKTCKTLDRVNKNIEDNDREVCN